MPFKRTIHVLTLSDNADLAESVVSCISGSLDETTFSVHSINDLAFSESGVTYTNANEVNLCFLLDSAAVEKWVKHHKQIHSDRMPCIIALNDDRQCVLNLCVDSGVHVSGVLVNDEIRSISLKRYLREIVGHHEAQLEIQSTNNLMTQIGVIEESKGLPSKGYFKKVLEYEWKRATRDALPISLLLVDIDRLENFNQVNEIAKREALLQTIAERIKYSVYRTTDTATNLGDGRYAIILSNTRSDGAERVAEKIRRGVEMLNIPLVSNGVVTVSVGVATMSADHSVKPYTIVRMASRVLEQCKNGGLNQVRCYQAASFGPVGKIVDERPHAFLQKLCIIFFVSCLLFFFI